VWLGDSARPVRGGNAQLVGDQIVFISGEGNLVAVPYDRATRRAGPQVVVQQGLRRSRFFTLGHFGFTRGGDLVYVPGSNGAVGQFVATHPGGASRVLPLPPKEYVTFALSPDGRRLAAGSASISGMEVWVYDVATGQGERVAVTHSLSGMGWGSGNTIALRMLPSPTSPGRTVFIPLQTGKPETLSMTVNVAEFVTPTLLVGHSGGDVMAVQLDRSRVARADTLRIPQNQYYPVVSPDRRWLAYSGAEKGITQVFVSPFPALDRQYKVSIDAASEPIWLPDRSLVYRTGTCWYRLALKPAAVPPLAAPAELFCDANFINTSGLSNRAMPDGSILYLRSVGPSTGGYVRVVKNWSKRLR